MWTISPTADATPALVPARLARLLGLMFVVGVLSVGRQYELLALSTKMRGSVPPTRRPVPPVLPLAERWDTSGSPATGIVTVGVAITITECGEFFPLDGVLVLRHSILRHPSERYRYEFYAVYHPEAAECVPSLASAGYTLLERDPMVNVSAIKSDYLRHAITRSGCCGEKELLKFEAFLLTQHPAVLLMDFDVMVMKPLDDVLDMILYSNPGKAVVDRNAENATAHAASTGDWWLLYVNDYYSAEPPYHVSPSQGGFAVLRPNRTIYSDLQQIVLEGDFHPQLGWGSATGNFWGVHTFQGLLPYYFQILHPGHALALDFCIHDHIHFGPTHDVMVGNETVARCRSPDCRNCLETPFEDTVSVHFTLWWAKPWHCEDIDSMTDYRQRAAVTWFRYRSEVEKSWGRSGRGSSNATHEELLGYCSSYGKEGYERIREPYGAPV